MAYTVNLTDGQIFAVVADGTINDQSSMVLVGKNYPGYGEFMNENFIHLLENSSDTVPPGDPLTGQLWWDKGTGTMKVYTGTAFKVISAATAAESAPSNNVTGDLWFDSVNQQLRVWNGASFTLIGPASASGQGTSGAIVTTIIDNASVPHVVIQFWIQNTLAAIMSRDAAFVPQVAIPGFATIAPGLQFSSAVANLLFRGTATDSNLLQGNPAANFMSAVSATQTTGTLSVANDLGLRVGLNSDLAVTVVGNDVTVANQTADGDLNLQVSVAGTPTNVISIDGVTGVPTAPTAAPGTNTTQIATTAFVLANQTPLATILQTVYPVGSIYVNTTNSTNPGTLLGFGTWVAFGAGRVMVGFDAADPLFDSAEETGGSKDAVVVSHTHTGTTNTTGAHTHTYNENTSPEFIGTGVFRSDVWNDQPTNTSSAGNHNHTFTTDSTGSSGTNANLPPYITVYMWKRTA